MTAQGSAPAGDQWKAPVLCAATSALPTNAYSGGVLTAAANGALTVDGVTVPSGARVLVTSEAAAANNGIYIATSAGSAGAPYVLTRTPDMAQGSQVPGAAVLAESGTVSGGAIFTLPGSGPYVIGTTAITWVLFSEAPSSPVTTYLQRVFAV